MSSLGNLSVLFLAISLTFFIIEPLFAPSLNSLIVGEEITTVSRPGNSTKDSIVRMAFSASASGLFLKWRWYPIYSPIGIYLFHAAEYSLYIGIAFLVASLVKPYFGKQNDLQTIFGEEQPRENEPL
jgi:hypothetical protein